MLQRAPPPQETLVCHNPPAYYGQSKEGRFTHLLKSHALKSICLPAKHENKVMGTIAGWIYGALLLGTLSEQQQ